MNNLHSPNIVMVSDEDESKSNQYLGEGDDSFERDRDSKVVKKWTE